MHNLEHLRIEYENLWYDTDAVNNTFGDHNNLIILPPTLRSGKEDAEDYAKDTVTFLIDKLNTGGWHKKILFYLPAEGFATTYMHFTQFVVKDLITKHNVSYKNLYYITGAADVSYNHNLYYKYCLEMNYIPLQICYANTFEAYQSIDANKREVFHSSDPKRKKKILFFNKQPRAHRLVAISELMRRNLRDKTFLSFLMTPERVKDFNPVKSLLPKFLDATTLYIRKLIPELPLNLTMQDDEKNMHEMTEPDMMLFRNSLFSLVAETLYHSSIDYGTEIVRNSIHCFPCVFHSEKIFKAIRAKHPFVLLSTPNSIAGLKELGYKSYHPYINEEYDNISDDQERLTAVMNEVERLANMSDEETKVWLENVKPIAQYNFDLLKTKQFRFRMYS